MAKSAVRKGVKPKKVKKPRAAPGTRVKKSLAACKAKQKAVPTGKLMEDVHSKWATMDVGQRRTMVLVAKAIKDEDVPSRKINTSLRRLIKKKDAPPKKKMIGKRPLNGYMRWVGENRDKFFGTSRVKAVNMGVKWKRMSTKQQEEFNRPARNELAKWKVKNGEKMEDVYEYDDSRGLSLKEEKDRKVEQNFSNADDYETDFS
jgi:hypothetical protein